MNFIDIGFYDVWDQVNIYKPGDNQNRHHIQLVGRKEQIDCSLQRGFYCSGQLLHTGLASPASQSFSHSGKDDQYLYPGAPHPPVSLWGNRSQAGWDSNLCYAVSKFPIKCPWTGQRQRGRAQVSQRKHWMHFQVFSLKALRTLHKHTQSQHLFQHKTILPHLKGLQVKQMFILWIPILFWSLLLTPTLLQPRVRSTDLGDRCQSLPTGGTQLPHQCGPTVLDNILQRRQLLHFLTDPTFIVYSLYSRHCFEHLYFLTFLMITTL